MKAYSKANYLALLASVLLAPGVAVGNPEGSKPCISVNIQNQVVNKASVEQRCGRNYSRTVQAGASNAATTDQHGGTNDNLVRQYGYDRQNYLEKIRMR